MKKEIIKAIKNIEKELNQKVIVIGGIAKYLKGNSNRINDIDVLVQEERVFSQMTVNRQKVGEKMISVDVLVDNKKYFMDNTYIENFKVLKDNLFIEKYCGIEYAITSR